MVLFWIQVVWDVTVCLRVSVSQNIEGSQCLHLHGLRVPRTSQHHVQEDLICHSHTYFKPKLITESVAITAHVNFVIVAQFWACRFITDSLYWT